MISLAKFCFLCLEGNSKIDKNLFSVENRDEDGIVMEEKLKYLFSEFQNFRPEIPKYICHVCIIEMNQFFKFRRKCLRSFTTIHRYLEQLSEKERENKNLSVCLQNNKNNKLQQDVSNEQNKIVEISQNENVSVLLEDLKLDKNLQCVINEKNSISTCKELGEAEERKALVHESKELDLLPVYQSDELSHHRTKKRNLGEKSSEINRINTNEENIKTEDLGLLSVRETDELNLSPKYSSREKSFSPNCQVMEEDLEEKFIVDNTEYDEVQKELEPILDVNVNMHKETSDSLLVVDESNKLNKELSEIPCVLSDEALTNSEDLINHSVQYSDFFKCEICYLYLRNKEQLDYHVKKNHHAANPFACSYCPSSFSKTGDLYSHTRLKHKDNINFVKPDVNINEENNSRDEVTKRNYKCQLCKKTFANLNNMKRHKLTHTVEKPFKCKMCDFRCSDAAYLVVHIRKHTGERPYKCDHCENTFSTSGYLTKHRRIIHKITKGTKSTTENINEENDLSDKKYKYKCQFCMKKFPSLGNLKRHKRIHAPEKKSECKLCSFKCSDPSYLVVHMRKHTDERPYKCDYCEKSFSTSSSLARHTRVIHKVEYKYRAKRTAKGTDSSTIVEESQESCPKIVEENSLLGTSTSMEFNEVNVKMESFPAPIVFEEEINDYGSEIIETLQPLEEEQYILPDL